jgi:hypothetical protein
MTDEHPPTDYIRRGRALMCRRGAAARSRVVEDGKVLDPDVRPGFPVGQCVVHVTFGLGKVTKRYDGQLGPMAVINFEKHGIKELCLQFVGSRLKPEDA